MREGELSVIIPRQSIKLIVERDYQEEEEEDETKKGLRRMRNRKEGKLSGRK